MQETFISRCSYEQLLGRCQFHQKCFIETANLFENTCSRYSAARQSGTSPVVLFSGTLESVFLLFFFFDCNVSSKNLLSQFLFVSSKNQTPCTFFYKLITSPTVPGVDIISDVLEISHVNVCSEILIKVAVCQHEVC